MIKEILKGFNINIDDLKPNEDFQGAIQKIAKKIAIEEEQRRFEIILNKNILDIKDKFTGVHSYMGLKISLDSFEKDISFIIKPTSKPTYDNLLTQVEKQKEVIDKLIELNQMINDSDYVYSQDEITAKNLDILKEVSE